jgi:N-carbamoyl-L-amino-acid hydrolase
MGKVGKKNGAKGVTRLALSDEDKHARDLLVSWFEKEDLDIKVDSIGNIFGIRSGTNPDAPLVVIGSHLDTVRSAGIYDGGLGVLSALEVVRKLNDEDVQSRYPIAVACFTNEEGARFQPAMMGSGVLSGTISLEEAKMKRDDSGISVAEALENINYKGRDSVTPGYFIELHVEQGPVLYENKINIGIVEGIQGIAWWRGEFIGEANHAGTTPIQYRKDSLLATAELYLELRKLAETHGKDSLTTMGRLNVEPDIINVIPEKVKYTIDFRQHDITTYERGKYMVENLVKKIAEKHRLDSCLVNVANIPPIRFHPKIMNLIEAETEKLNLKHIRMHSGAGHDAGSLCNICPTAMIFVPSVNGVSHSPEEKTCNKDIINGGNLLLQCILSLSKPI